MKLKIQEAKRFIVAGICAVITDLSFYYLLLIFFNNSISKGASFLVGSFVAYFINKFWTFEKMNHSFLELSKFYILYLFSLLINIYVNDFCIKFFETILLSFILATSVSALINFFGQKYWVFK